MEYTEIKNASLRFELSGFVTRAGPPDKSKHDKDKARAIDIIHTIRRGDGKQWEAIAGAIYHTGLNEDAAIELYNMLGYGRPIKKDTK